MKSRDVANVEMQGTGVRMWRWLVVCSLGAVCTAGLHAQQVFPSRDVSFSPASPSLANPLLAAARPSDASDKRLWKVSLATLTVANVLDVQSSLGKHELNSALSGPSGTLGTQGILLKSALQGGLMGIEYLVTRSRSQGSLVERPRSRMYRTLAIINFASTGVFTGIAVHNYTVPRGRP